MKYYIDTCIWRDYYENRFGQKGKPIGKYAFKFLMNIIKKKELILFSKLNMNELLIDYSKISVKNMLKWFKILGKLKFVEISKSLNNSAKEIAIERNLPVPDVLHALIARENNAILITRDNHFNKLKDIVDIKKPEELI